MSDIVENTDADKNTVSPEELDNLFSKKYNLLTETAVELNKTYVNHLCISESLDIAVTLLNNSIEVFRINKASLAPVCRLSGHEKSVNEVVFSPQEDYLLYSAGYDGIKLWDTRTGGNCVREYIEENDSPPHPYECMDVSCSGRVICVGSQMVKEDAYMIFWDKRKMEPLGGYWNSHTEDITQVKFHKERPEILASGSQDGLLNVYNLTEPNEDDALIYSMNIENSVEKITWLNDKLAACITQSNDLQIWDTSTGDKSKCYDREKITRSIKRSRPDECYLVDTYMSAEDNPVLLAGSYAGDGDILRSVNLTNKKLVPSANFAPNKQIVRCCAYNAQRDLLVTAGESGFVDVWSASEEVQPQEQATNKAQTARTHDSRHKPY